MNINFQDYIVVDPQIRFGKPTIKGTRIPVDLIIGKVAGGMAIKEVCKEYDLTTDQVYAALRYASAIVSQEFYLGS